MRECDDSSAVRVLLVEDDEDDYILTRELLVDVGEDHYRLEWVSSLDEAREAFARDEHDVCLLDYRLGAQTGLDLLRDACRLEGHAPIIVLTGQGDREVDLEAMSAGASDFLVKGSLDATSLDRSIRYALARRRNEDLHRRLLASERLASIGQLAAGVAHEINNPLAYLQANLHVLEDCAETCARLLLAIARGEVADAVGDSDMTGLEEAALEMGEMVRESLQGVARIRTIVRDLSSFSRSESDKIELIQINEVAESACNIVSSEIRRRCRLIKRLGPTPAIAASNNKLVQIAVNLLHNAAQAIPEGAETRNEIRVETCFKDGMVILAIEDTGAGIPESCRPNLFKPFFTTKRRGEGTGLGLSVVADLVKMHGGEVHFDSCVGKGTRFEVHIPEQTGLAVTARAPSATPADGSATGRVLIIDDEPQISRALSRLLKQRFQVVVAPGGGPAVDLLERDSDFDAVLCDLVMPDVDGPLVYEAVARLAPHLLERMVFHTGGATSSRIRAFLESVPNEIVEKPADESTLIKLLQQVCRRPRSPKAPTQDPAVGEPGSTASP